MEHNNSYEDSIKTISYAVPLLLTTSTKVLIHKSFYHISGYEMIGGQAVVFGIMLIVISLYVLYIMLYKLPKSKVNIELAKKVLKDFIKSSFFILLIITIVFMLFFECFPKNYFILVYVILLVFCYIKQKDFYDNINDRYNKIF